MATAKKCRHCGEWLTNTPNFTSYSFHKTSQKDSCLKSNCLYDRHWMNVLFWVTIITSFITYITLYQIIETIVPITIGIFWGSLFELIFLFLLMKSLPHKSRLLNIHFYVVLSLNVFLCILFVTLLTTGVNNENGYGYGQFLAYISDIIMALLGVQLVLNYEGMIKKTGWIIIAYYILSLMWSLIEDEIIETITFIIYFTLDYLYYRYMKDFLSK